jgi:putative FmdB family regulatory protein
MPRYDYVCLTCDIDVELQHSINDTTPHLCRVCNQVMQRAIPATPTIFKTGGFYRTGG